MERKGLNFETINRSAVPRTRNGKHHQMVEDILREAGGLRGKKALKIPRSELGSAKIQQIRAALSRASGRIGIELATSTDDQYFYVWRQD